MKIAYAINAFWALSPVLGKKIGGVPIMKQQQRKLAGQMNFNRIATFDACLQLDSTCNTDTETVSEIVAATEDGMMLVYTDSPQGVVGFVDIVDPKKPIAKGILDVGGEPTSVIVKDGYALTTVNTSPSYVDPSGKLVVIDIATQSIVREIELGGQPDSIALSPDHTYAAIAVENERDEDLNDGQLPQLPAGFLVIMNVADADPAAWTTSNVSVTDLPNVLYPTDPEPEYVYINSNNVCVLTLQENNAIVLIDLPTATVMASYSAGSVNLTQIDVDEDGIISPTGNQTHRLREPDSVVWIGDGHFAIANEGDLDGGSRGFTIFNDQGQIVYESYNTLEQEILRIGQYPEGRSENKGVEPEGLVYAVYGGSSNYLFITSERSSVVMVYDVSDVTNPVFKQVLPTNGGPEGIYAIPQRNLFIAACENDDRGNALRAGISIFELQDAPAAYPTMVSVNRVDGTPIPFSALSGLAAKMPRNYGSDAVEDSPILYTVEDSYFKQNRVLTIDTSDFPYHIVAEARIMDTNNVFADVLASAGLDASSIINADKTINVDLEGISVSHNGGFWVVHEGAGSVNDSTRPVVTPNILFKLSENVVIEQVVLLPSDVNDKQIRFGFEGCAEYGDEVVVAFQRAWVGEANPRIGIYNQNTTTWKFVFYPLDAPESQNGGWVGLSDVSSIGGGEFMFVERDNQGGPDAAIKRLYIVDLKDVQEGANISKTLFRDILPDLAKTNGNIYEKIEGLTVTASGKVWINNDNDGLDDNTGEQSLMDLGVICFSGSMCEELPSVPTDAPTTTVSSAFSVTAVTALMSLLVALFV